MQEILLSLLLFTPLLAAFIALFIPAAAISNFRYLTLAANIFQVIFLLFVMILYKDASGLQFVEHKPWITIDLGSWGILKAEYFIGLDGLSFPLVILSVFVMLIATISSWTIDHKCKGIFHTPVDPEHSHHRQFYSSRLSFVLPLF